MRSQEFEHGRFKLPAVRRSKRHRENVRSARYQFRSIAIEPLESRRLLSLTHQYTFNDGTASDAIGAANGTLVHNASVVSGWLNLQNISINPTTAAVTNLTSGAVAAQYLQLPAGVLPSSGSTTIEVWYTSSSALPASTRIFAFGDQVSGAANSSLSYTPRGSSNDARAVLHPAGGSDRIAALSGGTFNGAPHMAVIVVDSSAAQLKLYVDSVLITSTALSGAGMNSVSPLLAFLGRSLNDSDPAFNGSINELRIYDDAEPATSVLAAYTQGAAQNAPTGPTRQMEYMSRGVVATQASSSQVFVSWRLLAFDPPGIGFYVYRSANGGGVSNSITRRSPQTQTIPTRLPTRRCRTVILFAPCSMALNKPPATPTHCPPTLPLARSIQIPLRNIGNYRIRHMSVADLDGDGKYDYIVDRMPPSVNEVALHARHHRGLQKRRHVSVGHQCWAQQL